MSYLSGLDGFSSQASEARSGSGSSGAGSSSLSVRSYPRFSELYTLINTITVLRKVENDSTAILCQNSEAGVVTTTHAFKCSNAVAKIEERLLSQTRAVDVELHWHTERAASSNIRQLRDQSHELLNANRQIMREFPILQAFYIEEENLREKIESLVPDMSVSATSQKESTNLQEAYATWLSNKEKVYGVEAKICKAIEAINSLATYFIKSTNTQLEQRDQATAIALQAEANRQAIAFAPAPRPVAAAAYPSEAAALAQALAAAAAVPVYVPQALKQFSETLLGFLKSAKVELVANRSYTAAQIAEMSDGSYDAMIETAMLRMLEVATIDPNGITFYHPQTNRELHLTEASHLKGLYGPICELKALITALGQAEAEHAKEHPADPKDERKPTYFDILSQMLRHQEAPAAGEIHASVQQVYDAIRKIRFDFIDQKVISQSGIEASSPDYVNFQSVFVDEEAADE